jgi:hypothetical protein|tara:strand:+ start:423 stop:959 length:537 start_codon:yes stop_codon:yes gene_type:complete
MNNPLNSSWYSTGTDKYSILDEVATATDTRESVVQKEVENILASSECKHSVMEVMVDMSSVWMFASVVSDDLKSSLRDLEDSIDSIEDVLGGGDYDVDWHDDGDEVKITVSKYDGSSDAESYIRDARSEIETAVNEIKEKLSDVRQEDIDPQNIYHLCTECRATFNHEEVRYVKAAQA